MICHIQFYVEAWKAEDFLTQDRPSISHMVIFHARKHETHRRQIHNQGPNSREGINLPNN